MTETAKTAHIILGQRKLQGMTDLIATRQHNNREMLVPNVDPSGPDNVQVFGDEDIWVAVRDRLQSLGIKVRKGGVMALELMITTSPEVWEDPAATVEKHREMRAKLEAAVMHYLAERFAAEALISMVWHLDETTPHLHIVAVPIRQRVDGRANDKTPRWALSARGDLMRKGVKFDPLVHDRTGLGGKSQMAYEQTRLAQITAPLGLSRGKVWSGMKNIPNREHQANLAAAIVAAETAKAAGEAAKAEYEGKLDSIKWQVKEAEDKVFVADQDMQTVGRRFAAMGEEANRLTERQDQIDVAGAALDQRESDVGARESDIGRERGDLTSRVEAVADAEAALTVRAAELDAMEATQATRDAAARADAEKAANNREDAVDMLREAQELQDIYNARVAKSKAWHERKSAEVYSLGQRRQADLDLIAQGLEDIDVGLAVVKAACGYTDVSADAEAALVAATTRANAALGRGSDLSESVEMRRATARAAAREKLAGR